MKAALLFTCIVTVATTAGAQELNPRWQPWLGCWQVTGGEGQVCVAAAGSDGVTLTTRVNGEPEFVQTIVADAAEHRVSELGCTGTQHAEWSADGRRLFTRASLVCKDQPSRAVSGMSLMTGQDEWLDIQGIEIARQTTVRVRRYQRSTKQSAERSLSAAAFTIDAVKEAAGKVAPAALEAALTETKSRFALNRRALIDLDEANVPDSVIDLMVAMSYPERFQVERRPESRIDAYPTSLSAFEPGFWGLGYPYYSAYEDYNGYYRYYSSPFGWLFPGYYQPLLPAYYYSGGTNTDTGPRQNNDARVVNGVGYTLVRPREALRADAPDSGGSAGSSGPARVGSSGYSSGAASSSGSSDSSGSGSSGSGGGRTAQPR